MDHEMSQPSKATFHPFTRLPAELRIQIWELATENRVLEVRTKSRFGGHVGNSRGWGNWSPTLVPAITRACRESREHCSYQKAFTMDLSPRYIWTNFDHDFILLFSGVEQGVLQLMERQQIRHLRIYVGEGPGDSEYFWHYNSQRLRDYPKLESCDVVVPNLDHEWTAFIKETYWGACPRRNVRIVDAKTGAFIDEETSDTYQDYLDNYVRTPEEVANFNLNSHTDEYTFTRIEDSDTVVWDPGEETLEEFEKWKAAKHEERIKAMRRLQIPLPRIDLSQ